MATEAQLRATERYNAKKYDKITFRVLKGEKEEIEKAAAAAGMSLNSFITEAIKEKLQKLR